MKIVKQKSTFGYFKAFNVKKFCDRLILAPKKLKIQKLQKLLSLQLP